MIETHTNLLNIKVMKTIQLTDEELQLLSDLHGYINDEDFMQMNYEDDESAVDDSNTWESIYKKVVEAMGN